MAHRTDDHSDLTLFKNRLWKLMEEKHIYTTKELAKILYNQKLVNVRQKSSYDEPSKIYGNAVGAIDKKIQKHLNADTAKELQGEFVIAYCTFFGCSSDYLFGFIDCKTHDRQFINTYTGLSEKAIKKLEYYNQQMHEYTESLNILLVSANFENALSKIKGYMNTVKLTDGLMEIRQERRREVFSKQPDGENGSYNWPYNDNLDKAWSDSFQKEELLEYNLDTNFRYIIQELASLAGRKK